MRFMLDRMIYIQRQKQNTRTANNINMKQEKKREYLYFDNRKGFYLDL